MEVVTTTSIIQYLGKASPFILAALSKEFTTFFP